MMAMTTPTGGHRDDGDHSDHGHPTLTHIDGNDVVDDSSTDAS